MARKKLKQLFLKYLLMMESIEQVHSRLLANLLTFKLLINLMEIKADGI